jgi:hypothetical protein
MSASRLSPSGDRHAYIERLPSSWVQGNGAPMLQLRGRIRLLHWDTDEAQAIDSIDDASQVIGWLDENTLVVTRSLPGDFAEQRPFLVDIGSGEVRALIRSNAVQHLHSFVLIDRVLYYSRSEDRIITMPHADQRVELVALRLDTLTERVLRTEVGALPTELSPGADKGTIKYVLEGSGLVRSIDLSSGAVLDSLRDPQLSTSNSGQSATHPPDTTQLYALFSMPYIHQVYDTPDDFNGNWACGPTSTVMAICHFGRLKAWPVTASTPSKHQSNYGAYVGYKYTAYGTTFDRMQTDASGNASYGAYGWCTDGGAAWAYRMQDFAKKHGLKSDFYDNASFDKVQTQINAGQVVVLSTKLTSAGHIITVKGISGSKLVVNDPYGDKNAGYMNYKGEGAQYTWSQVNSSWFITVYSDLPSYKATIISKDGPSTMTSGETKDVTVVYRNDGANGWDDSTTLGTSVARDRTSDFYASSWLSKNHIVHTGVTLPGSQATVKFKVTAPQVCSSTKYTEHFNLLEEGVAWFSDAQQGGPADNALAFDITVNPTTGSCQDAGTGGQVDAGPDSTIDAAKDSSIAEGGKDGSDAALSQESSVDTGATPTPSEQDAAVETDAKQSDSAATGSDSGAPTSIVQVASDSGDGCSCKVGVGSARRSSQSTAWILSLLGLSLIRGRRRAERA